MKLIEQFCLGKRKDQSLNEDALVISDHYVAVIDGATSSPDVWGKPGGLLAREILSSYISSARPAVNGFQFMLDLNQRLYEEQQSSPPLFEQPGKRMMASVLVFSVEASQIWSYGDCQYYINDTYHCFDKKVDRLNADVRSYVNQYYLGQGSTAGELLANDRGAEMIKKLIELQPYFANTDCEYGYPIIDGGTLCESLFTSQTLHPGDMVVMATDGYPVLKSTLEDSEKELARVKALDPLCIGQHRSVKGFYPGQNSFDDRAYIRFIV